MFHMCKINNVRTPALFGYASTQILRTHIFRLPYSKLKHSGDSQISMRILMAAGTRLSSSLSEGSGKGCYGSLKTAHFKGYSCGFCGNRMLCPKISAAFEPDGNVTGNILFPCDRHCLGPLHSRHLCRSRRNAD